LQWTENCCGCGNPLASPEEATIADLKRHLSLLRSVR
jgi:hypothetical protein